MSEILGRWAAYKNLPGLTLDLYLYDDRQRSVGEPCEIVMTPREPNTSIQPTLRLPIEHAEQIFMALWNAGCRPPEERVSDKTLEAQERHIVFAEKVASDVLRMLKR